MVRLNRDDAWHIACPQDGVNAIGMLRASC
jgi:hypothetical protein